MIEVKDLKKHFRTFKKEQGLKASIKSLFHREFVDVKALDGISLDVKQGEIRGFIGPNGAGKSTTIKILSGVLYPTSGYVSVNGFEPWKQREKYVKNIGVVFGQKQQLWLDLPSVDTFHLNKEIYDIPQELFTKNLDYFVKLFDLEDIIRRPARQLSLGEKMKCELIAALLHDPKIVFLDEPTIGLDVLSKEKIRQFIKKVNKDKGITFLLTTHDLDDIENLCQKITIINQGKIIYDDTLQKIKAEIDTKILDVKFSKALKEYKVPEGIKILNKGDMEIKIEVDKKKHKVDEVIGYILKHYAINDINVSNPEIEDIIKKIYSQSK
ncbi:MAG: ATP-binding cassette domain-containing protein [Candidatus Woesearchaeota archaeon]|nr:ATP-binding cassette domain-containing protein [Candidatus Woesearchaeota archaeon]